MQAASLSKDSMGESGYFIHDASEEQFAFWFWTRCELRFFKASSRYFSWHVISLFKGASISVLDITNTPKLD